MPLTAKGERIKAAMQKEYGSKKGESVFYASRNKGRISGVESRRQKLLEATKRLRESMFPHPRKRAAATPATASASAAITVSP